MYLLCFHINGCLNDRTFGSSNNNFIIGVVKCGPNSFGVAEKEGIAVSQHPANNVTSIPNVFRLSDKRSNVQIFFNFSGYHLIIGVALFDNFIFTLYFSVEFVAERFQHQKSIRFVAWMLSLCR